MYTHTLIGTDAGQSDTNVSIRVPGKRGGKGHVEHLTFPSVIGGGDPAKLQHLMDAIEGGNGVAPHENPREWMILEMGGSAFYVGELGYKEGRNPTTRRGDAERYAGGHTRKLFLAAVGRMIENKWMSNGSVVRLVTGIPLEWHTTSRKLAVRASLMGTHEWIYLGKKLRVTVDAIGVMPEGPVLLHRTAHLPIQQCAGDCGWGTTELYWAFGRTPNQNRSQGKKTGIGRIADEINAAIRLLTIKGHRRGDLSEWDMRRVLRAHIRHEPYPTDLNVRGEKLAPYLAQIVPSAVATVQAEVTGFIGATWGDEEGTIAVEAEEAWFGGGGAYFFGDAVRELIPQVKISDAPEFDTSDAYLAVAEAATEEHWNRNRATEMVNA